MRVSEIDGSHAMQVYYRYRNVPNYEPQLLVLQTGNRQKDTDKQEGKKRKKKEKKKKRQTEGQTDVTVISCLLDIE